MQTLNVGAGRTDKEYKEAEEQRRADLRAESRSDANYFFWAAGLAALGTGLLPVRLNILVNIGVFDLLGFYGRSPSPLYPLAMYGATAAWLVMLVALGFVGRSGHRWAFLAGMVYMELTWSPSWLLFRCGHSVSTPSSCSNGSRDKKR
jgi:hypothetical protein